MGMIYRTGKKQLLKKLIRDDHRVLPEMTAIILNANTRFDQIVEIV
jgi:hypothetical protein